MKVAIVMAVYNGEAYLAETIDSILAQTYMDLEIIIVDDGSTDGTRSILDNIRDPWVRIIHSGNNQGAAHALNVGIESTDAKWIAIHDADDLSSPNRIEEQVTYIQSHPDVVAVGSFIECIKGYNISDAQSGRLQNLQNTKNSIITCKQIKVGLFHGCPLTHGSIMLSKDAFIRAGGYNPEYKIGYDYELYTRLIALGPIENVPKVLYKYRISANSLSNLNIAKTSSEFLLACTKYIHNCCFSHKEAKPKVIVYGTHEGCRTFEELMLSRGPFDVQLMVNKFEKKIITRIYDKFVKGKIDAFIVLDNAPDQQKIIRFLERKGLRQNRDFFTLWSGI